MSDAGDMEKYVCDTPHGVPIELNELFRGNVVGRQEGHLWEHGWVKYANFQSLWVVISSNKLCYNCNMMYIYCGFWYMLMLRACTLNYVFICIK